MDYNINYEKKLIYRKYKKKPGNCRALNYHLIRLGVLAEICFQFKASF